MKASLIIIVLAWLACLAAIESLPAEPIAASISRSPSFEVRVVMPRLGLPLAGILPDPLVTYFDCTPRTLGFDHTSAGAAIGRVEHDRLELSAEGGWDLTIETDGEGHVAPGTHLVVPMGLGGSQVRLRCRPADPGIGYLRTTARAGAGELGGTFLVELADCEHADSGKAIEWPPASITVRGSFDRLRQSVAISS